MAENDPLNPSDARYLLRRTTFGPTQAEVDFFSTRTRGQAADLLLSYKPSGFKPGGSDLEKLHGTWVKYMLKTKTNLNQRADLRSGLQEKLVLFWHDHFATAISKVFTSRLMGQQNQLFRRMGKGSFKDLVKAVNRDPAMMEYLDTVRNRVGRPNENYGRELLELFTLGVFDFAGKANYAQADVPQFARAFSGWYYEGARVGLDTYAHDFAAGPMASDRGPKTVFETPVDQVDPPGGTAVRGRDFAEAGEGEIETDTVIEILFDHVDSQSYNTVARRTAKRLIEYFSHPNPSTAMVDDVVSASSFATTWSIRDLLKQIFVHDDFYPSTNPSKPRSVKWPIDMVVQTMRLLNLKPVSPYMFVGNAPDRLLSQVSNMGQVLFDPPSVFGWDWEGGWVSSSTLLARYGFANGIVEGRSGAGRLRIEKLVSLDLTDPGDIVDAVTGLLGVQADFPVGSGDRDTLIAYLGGPSAVLSLHDSETADRLLRGLFGLVMQSPAYQVH